MSKPISEFRILRGRWPSSWCKSCAVARTRQWRAANPAYIALANAARRIAHQPIACLACGLAFVPRRSDSLHCCPECSYQHRSYGQPSQSWIAVHHLSHREQAANGQRSAVSPSRAAPRDPKKEKPDG